MDRLNDVLRHRTTLYLMLAFWASTDVYKDGEWLWVRLGTATIFVLCALLELVRHDD